MSQPEQAYDYKYSDRDVRETPELAKLALNYIHEYGGSFEPLIKIKHFLAYSEDDELTTAQIRVILNCMRHDVTIAHQMPRPRFPFAVPRTRFDGGAVVIPMQRNRRREMGEVACDNEKPHDHHLHSSGDAFCRGVAWPITRFALVPSNGVVKRKFAAGRTGLLVHKLTGQATFYWQPYRHNWGFHDYPVKVKVKTCCKNPSWLTDAGLFVEEPTHLYTGDEFGKERCSRCFSVNELREGPTLPSPVVGLEDVMPRFLPPVCMIPDCGCSGFTHA